MADAYDICVKANRMGFALGDSFDEKGEGDFRVYLASKIAELSDRGDMQTLADLISDMFNLNAADVIDVINYLRDRNNSLDYKKSIGYSLAMGIRGPIKR